MSILSGSSLAVGSALATEILLRRTNPYRLWRNAFDEAETTDMHPVRGWTPKRSHRFNFNHRYLKQKNGIAL